MTRDPTIDERSNLRAMVLVIYALFIAGWLVVGLTSVIGVIIAYVKRGDAVGTPYASHFANQITIFWVHLIVGVVGFLLTFVAIGWLVLGLLFVWTLYRIVKGILRALDGAAYA